MNTTDKIMALADEYASAYGAWTETRVKRREALRAEIEALERFGAGGYDWRPADCAPLDGSHFLARTFVGNESVVREAYFSGQRDISGRPIFCVPITKMLCVVHEWTCLPADLRGLEDAADECRNTAKRLGSEWMAEHCAEAIEALKGKK